MQSKSLLIAIAAFAVTATGVQAYGGAKLLKRAGLEDRQVSAIVTAQHLQASGDSDAARDVLVNAGVTGETLLKIHSASQQSKLEIHQSLETRDYASFSEIVADTPLAKRIISEANFMLLVQAHDLRLGGSMEESLDILDELGIEVTSGNIYVPQRTNDFAMLTHEQKEVFQFALQSNDRATMQAVLDESGLDGR
jgi:hypothetical protein